MFCCFFRNGVSLVFTLFHELIFYTFRNNCRTIVNDTQHAQPRCLFSFGTEPITGLHASTHFDYVPTLNQFSITGLCFVSSISVYGTNHTLSRTIRTSRIHTHTTCIQKPTYSYPLGKCISKRLPQPGDNFHLSSVATYRCLCICTRSLGSSADCCIHIVPAVRFTQKRPTVVCVVNIVSTPRVSICWRIFFTTIHVPCNPSLLRPMMTKFCTWLLLLILFGA